ncbi:hypothetical protein Tco_0204580 [Tanacetum coccineum]
MKKKLKKQGKVVNWESANMVESDYDEDVHDLKNSLKLNSTHLIIFKDNGVASNENTLLVSFDESNDDDYTVIFDKNSFSYKIIYVNDLKTDSKNDNEKVNMPSFPSPELKVSYFDDLDFFKDFENEFPAIVYNDALTSKSNFLTEPTLKPQPIDKFDLKDETSLSEYGEVEQNMLYFNDLFPFNIIYPDNLKSGKDNDDNEIDIIQSSRGNVNTQGSNKLLEASYDKINNIFNVKSFIMELKIWRLYHLMIRDTYGFPYQVEGYTKEIVHDFEQRLETIFGRQVNQVHILDFEGLTPDMRQDLAERLRMVYTGDDGHKVFVSHAWRRLFEIQAPLVHDFLLEFFSTCRIGSEMGLDVADTLSLF